MEPSKDKGWWVCTDKLNKIVVRFEHKKFNETQQVAELEDFDEISALKLATTMREISDWLVKYHRDKVE